MKLIDLFNKIVNKEKLPNKIRIRNDILIRNENFYLPYLQDYYYMDGEENATWKIWYYDLNDEVEIIEDNKTIETLDLDWADVLDFKEQAQQDCVKMVFNKINEIIDKINKMED